MSNPHLPPEILDCIVDTLHDEPKTLRNCCLVAKPWVPRTRKHLFAEIKFSSPKALESWKKTFPDASSSPAYHTRTLLLRYPQVVTAADTDESNWVRTFSRVVRLEVGSKMQNLNDSEVTLAPFHGLSPVLKTLRVFSTLLPHSRVFGLIRSLPLLENLTFVVYKTASNGDLNVSEPPIKTPPLSSPALTGTLELLLCRWMEPTVRWLLDLPGGIRFRSLMMSWVREDDLQWLNALVVGCSDTLESFVATCCLLGGSPQSSIDLSKATRLKDTRFWCGRLSAQWITAALQTLTSNHRDLRQISIRVPYNVTLHGTGANIRQTIGETTYEEWLDLDRLLIQLWELRSVRPRINYLAVPQSEEKEVVDCVSCLLPEVTKRGVLDLEKYRRGRWTKMV